MLLTILCAVLAVLVLFVLYILRNDNAIHHIPDEVLALSPNRLTGDKARAAYEKHLQAPLDILDRLPPKTGRRYVVVGGAGFLGGWIVIHLIRRGEDPRNIRILDIRSPTRRDLLTGSASQADFIQIDVSDRDAVFRAFNKPWPKDSPYEEGTGITVFHTAANIRFFERHPDLLPRSTRVNAQGTQNVLDAARHIGVDTMVYTSSGSVSVHSTRFWLWPWESRPQRYVQGIDDDDGLVPKRHEGFFSNYAASKAQGERLVREANRTPTACPGIVKGDCEGEGRGGSRSNVLRTGCLKPGNGVFGPGGDMLCGAQLVRKNNPTWIEKIVQNFVYVENCSLAHLCYERKLIEAASASSSSSSAPSSSPGPQDLQDSKKQAEDLSGRSYTICDAGPPPTYGDVYTLMHTLTNGLVVFPSVSPTLMLLIAHLVEAYHLLQSVYLPRISTLPLISSLLRMSSLARLGAGLKLPPITGAIINLQPSLFSLVQVHLIFDDSRARRELGYNPLWTTVEGLCKTVEEHEKEERLREEEEKEGTANGRAEMAGVTFSFNIWRRGKKEQQVKLETPETKKPVSIHSEENGSATVGTKAKEAAEMLVPDVKSIAVT